MLRQQFSTAFRSRRKNVTRWIRYGAAGICAFLAANVRILGGFSPFGTAFAAALPPDLSLAAAIGGLLGGLTGSPFADSLPYLASLLCILAFKLLLAGHRTAKIPTPLLCVLSAVSLGGCLTVSDILNHASGIGICLSLAEGLLCGALTWFAVQGIRTFPLFFGEKARTSAPSRIQSASLWIAALFLFTGLCGISFSVFHLGRILSALFLLCVSNRRKPETAAAAGLTLAAALTLVSPELALSGGVLAFSALLAAIFSPFGKAVQIALFLLGNTAGILVTGGSPETLTAAFDVLAASACFLFVPERLLKKFAPAAAPSLSGQPLSESGHIAARLRFAAGTVSDIRESVDAVSRRLSQVGTADISDVYSKASDRVCRRCGLKLYCWETAYNQANDALQKLTPNLRKNGRITKEDLPPFFRSKCPKTDELIREINGNYHAFLSHENAGRKVLGAKQVALEQLEGVAEMLKDAGNEIAEGELSDPAGAAKVCALLEELGEDPGEVYCVLDRFDRLRIEIYRKAPFSLDQSFLTRQLSDRLNRPFDNPCIVTAGLLTKICFFEEAQYTLQFASAQKIAENNRVSGDCCEYFADPRGYAHILLSDGMGCGGRAAVDSVMTCSFVLKLVKAGFGFDSALKFINSALLVKAGDESLATLDIACIDLYAGTAEFLKAGAASSFLLRDGKVVILSGNSLPAGILQGISYDRRSIPLREGDVLVLVTDGALPISEQWFADELQAVGTLPPKEAAEKLALLAKRRQQQPEDDITVAVAKVCRTA